MRSAIFFASQVDEHDSFMSAHQITRRVQAGKLECNWDGISAIGMRRRIPCDVQWRTGTGHPRVGTSKRTATTTPTPDCGSHSSPRLEY